MLSNDSAIPSFKQMISRLKRHSTTRLLYLVPTVRSFGLGVTELAITRLTLSGTVTSMALSLGLNSINFALFNSAKMEIVWSIPPQAVPAILSAVTQSWLKSPLGITVCRLFACRVTIAAHTVNAELDETPAAGGTCESMSILKPLGLATLLWYFSSIARTALYPQMK